MSSHNTQTAKPQQMTDANTAWLEQVTFTADGLIPAIAQDKDSGEILMMAWMNKEALHLTAQTKTAVYFSRSRGKLWHKGESSGHTQIVHDIHLDCDADVIVLTVTQIGDIACHTGRRSCFYRKLDLSGGAPSWQTVAPVLKDPDAIYDTTASESANDIIAAQHTAQDGSTDTYAQPASQTQAHSVLQQLDAVLVARKKADANSSYVASLYAKGLNKILEKVGEEAVESIIAAKDLAALSQVSAPNTQNSEPLDEVQQALSDDLIYEIADVWFHTLVTLAWFNIGSDRILAELARRFGLSGIEEKNSRPH